MNSRQRGECWPDSRLAAALGVGVGDALAVGALNLRVSRILISRPDQGSAFVELAPALLINDADLGATQLVQPAQPDAVCGAARGSAGRAG